MPSSAGAAGTALLAEAKRVATQAGCTRLCVITTNDNIDALRFSQRRGSRLAALHRGAVDESRARLTPEIPETGDYRIPLHDELELENDLVPEPPASTPVRPRSPRIATKGHARE